MAKELKLRGLETDDAFLLSEIADKMDLTIDFDALSDVLGSARDNGNVSATMVGITALGKTVEQVVKRMHRARAEIVQLISQMSDLTEDEVRKLPVKTLIGAVRQIISMEGALDFLSSDSE